MHETGHGGDAAAPTLEEPQGLFGVVAGLLAFGAVFALNSAVQI